MSRLEVQGKGQGASVTRPGLCGRANDEGPEPAPLLVIGGYRAPKPAAPGSTGGGLAHSARPMWAVTNSGLQGWPAQAGSSRATAPNSAVVGPGPSMWGPSAARTAGMFRDMTPASGFHESTLALAAAAMVAAASQTAGRAPSGQQQQLRRSSSGFSSLAGAPASLWASSTNSSVASAHSYTSSSGCGVGGGGGICTYATSGQSNGSVAAPLPDGGGSSFRTGAAAPLQQPPFAQQQLRPLSGGVRAGVGPHGPGGRAASARGGATAPGASSVSMLAETSTMPAFPNATSLATTSAGATTPEAKAAAVACKATSSDAVGTAAPCAASPNDGPTGFPLPASGDAQPQLLGQGSTGSVAAADLQAAVSPAAHGAGYAVAEATHSNATCITAQASSADSAAHMVLVGDVSDADRDSVNRRLAELAARAAASAVVPLLALPSVVVEDESGADEMPHTSAPRKRRSSKRRSTASATCNRGSGTPRRSTSGSSRSNRPTTVASSPGLASYPASPRAVLVGGGSISSRRSGNALIPSGTAAGPSPGSRGSSGCGAMPVRRVTSSQDGDGGSASIGALGGLGAGDSARSVQVDAHGPSHAGRPPLPRPSPRDVPAAAAAAEAATAAAHEPAGSAALHRQLSSASSNGSNKAAAVTAVCGEELHACQMGATAAAGLVMAASLAPAGLGSKPATPLLPSLHVRTSGRLLDVPATPPHLGSNAASRASSHLGGVQPQPDSPSCAAHARLVALQSASPGAACSSTPHSPAGAAAGVAAQPHPRRPSLGPLSPSAVFAGLTHAVGYTGAHSSFAEVEVAASASSHHAAELAAPCSPLLGPRPPSHLTPLGQPPLMLHQGPAMHHTSPPAAVGPASRVVSQLKNGVENCSQLNLRGTAPAGFMAAGGSSGADVGSPQNAAMVDAGDGIALASGSKPKSAAAGAFASRRSSRQASPARTSLFHTQQLTGGGGSSRSAAVAAASVDPEEQVRKAQERLEAYNRAQKETTRAAEAEEAARRQRHADERNRHNLAKERRRVEIYALNALLALSEAARTQLLVEAMTAQGQGQDAQGLQASGGGADTSSGAAAEGAAGSSGGAADDFDAGLTDDAQDSGSEEEVGPQVSANHSKGIALLRHGV